ncbi:MAG: hypothetical protein KME10_19070 [Plectolyngbya sp. WJT66-NPBG17]|jgi:hypothetical protein|nr:hypothetical protein [Plectolyngbya sp. WJT66-NPBG17]
MPKVSGKDLISDLTEKNGRRLMVVSFLTLIIKIYNVDLSDFLVFGIKLPSALFDRVAWALIIYFTYALCVNWIVDLAAFRLWFDSNQAFTREFGTFVRLDKNFIAEGTELLTKLYKLENAQSWENFEDLDPDIREKFIDVKTNVQIYCDRLNRVGQQFSSISKYGQFYVWFQSFILPILLALWAIFVLLHSGSFPLPNS